MKKLTLTLIIMTISACSPSQARKDFMYNQGVVYKSEPQHIISNVPQQGQMLLPESSSIPAGNPQKIHDFYGNADEVKFVIDDIETQVEIERQLSK